MRLYHLAAALASCERGARGRRSPCSRWDPGADAALRGGAPVGGKGDPFEIADALEKVVLVETGEAAAAIAMRLFALRSEQGDVEAAERALEAGMRAHPTNPELSDLLIARYQNRGAYRELSALLRQAFDRAPDNLSLLGALLDAYRRIGAFDAARDVVTAALERTPGDASLYRERAALHEVLGMTSEALSDFEKAFAVAGTPHLEDYVQALKRQAARTEPPDDRPIKLKLSQVLCATGFADAGRTHLAELLKRDAKDKVALRALSELEYREERWEAASASYRRLLPLEDADALADTALRLADACERASRLADARSGLERALKAPTRRGQIGVSARLYEPARTVSLAELMCSNASSEGCLGAFLSHMRAAAALLGGDAARLLLRRRGRPVRKATTAASSAVCVCDGRMDSRFFRRRSKSGAHERLRHSPRSRESACRREISVRRSKL
jgi:tetratricopeptide (TPR) repeat protein